MRPQAACLSVEHAVSSAYHKAALCALAYSGVGCLHCVVVASNRMTKAVCLRVLVFRSRFRVARRKPCVQYTVVLWAVVVVTAARASHQLELHKREEPRRRRKNPMACKVLRGDV